jgi:GNAT superfamily N-acetyltransferase
VGDGLTIVYLQDLLVRPEAQRGGIGRDLLTHLLEPYADVRQKVLLTDTEPTQRAFYEALGFTELRDHEPELRAFVRFG